VGNRLLGRLSRQGRGFADLTKIEIVGLEGPVPELTGAVKESVGELIAVARRQLLDEAAIRDFALGLLQRGPSSARAHLPREFELTRSWFFEEQFFYEVCNPRLRAVLVTSLIDRGHAINTVWFVDDGVAVAVQDHATDVRRFNRFLDATLRRDGRDRKEKPHLRRLVTGFPHMLHVLWNGISPVIALAQEDNGATDFEVHVLFEPFGPIERLVPELSGTLRRVSRTWAADQNDGYEVNCGVAGWRITREAQSRIINLAKELSTTASREASAAFASRFSPVIWVTAKPGHRTFINEAVVLADLITRLSQLLPKAGFIIDGASYPWDFHHNSNYDGRFRSQIAGVTAKSDTHIKNILQGLPSEVHDRTVVLNGIDVHDEIVWGCVADFYVAHGGSMQHKIGWIHDVPGYVHSNQQFLDHFKHIRFSPVEAGTVVYYPSEGVLLDDDPAGYSSSQLAWKSQKYVAITQEGLYDDVWRAMRSSGIVAD
jgi:hypothetical protein